MKLVIFTTIFTLILVFLLPAILTLGVRNIPAADQPPLNGTEKIYGSQLITQTFVSTDDNLSGIGLTFKNPNLVNKENLNFILEGENVTRSLIINGGSIPDGGFIKFLFKPINNSEGKQFSFTLAAQNATDDKALEVFYSPAAPNSGILAISDKEASGSSISFVTFHKVNNKLELVGEVYSHWLWKLTKDITFFIIYSILIGGFSILLLFRWKKI